MFFDVSFERNEILMDKIRNFLIRIRLSFQLSACASSRRRREINKQRFLFSFRLRESRIDVFDPINEHSSPSFEKSSRVSTNVKLAGVA